jgi:hypothetical protein
VRVHDREGTLKLGVAQSASDTDNSAIGVWRDYGPGERLRRAAVVAAIGIGGALLMLPIPLVHLGGLFVLLPGSLFLAFIRLRTPSMLRSATGPCPRCQFQQSFFTGLGLRAPVLPSQVTCASCHREIWLRMP